jgi:hypothetical protein
MGDTGILLSTNEEQTGPVEFPVTQAVQLSQASPRNWSKLTCGIDSLHLAISVDWTAVWPVLEPQLRQAKEQAEGSHGVVVDLGVGKSVVLPGGRRNFKYNVHLDGWNLMVANSPVPTSHANVFAMLHSNLIWQAGPQEAVTRAVSVIEKLGGSIHTVMPSRVDLCADFVIRPGLSFHFLDTHRVSRCQHVAPHLLNGRLETYVVGNVSSPIRMQIYDKGREIDRANGQEWFKEIWGLDNPRDVWRVEFQVKRDALRQMAFDTLEDVLASTGGLWTYLTTNWFSLRDRDNQNTARRSIHPWWKSVQARTDEFASQRAVNRVYRGGQGQALQRFITQMAGCVESFAAQIGIDDQEVALDHFQNAIGEVWKHRNFKAKVEEKTLKRDLAMQGGAL